jgi:hypothetical protein
LFIIGYRSAFIDHTNGTSDVGVVITGKGETTIQTLIPRGGKSRKGSFSSSKEWMATHIVGRFFTSSDVIFILVKLKEYFFLQPITRFSAHLTEFVKKFN